MNEIEKFAKASKYEDMIIDLHSYLETYYNDARVYQYSEGYFGIGYGEVFYETKTYETTLPIITLGPWKSHLGFYIADFNSAQNILNKYKDLFPKSYLGKGCLKIKKLDNKNFQIIKKIIDEIYIITK